MQMLNFTVGPVQSSEDICEIGGQQVPYFRTPEFSRIMIENEALMLEFIKAPEGSRAVFLTGSGTASMEAAVINTLTENDRALVVNGGSFGQRFVELLKLHKVSYTEIRPESGRGVQEWQLLQFENKGYTAFLVNIDETSTGVLHDCRLIGEFCRRNGLFLIVDAISSFLADDLDMAACHADVVLTGSQKALACPPGVSIVMLSPRALKRIEDVPTKCRYLDLKDALKNAERGQTPFTPAVGILLQINARLRQIRRDGGVEKETERIHALAQYFREQIKKLPFEIISKSLSNAVTPLHPKTASAYDIFMRLKDEYGIWVCPNGGAMKDTVFRVGHIGALTYADYDKLLNALKDMQRKGMI